MFLFNRPPCVASKTDEYPINDYLSNYHAKRERVQHQFRLNHVFPIIVNTVSSIYNLCKQKYKFCHEKYKCLPAK